ncbi:MAG: polysaccharide lyase [Planctomycetes bacterium]|nr:polysaccharide lyase [Planctomycetota bacterium]
MTGRIGLLVLGLAIGYPSSLRADDAALRREADEALRRATNFFRSQVATEGGYLWRYSEDLTTREGEGRAADSTVWVQPPGTPSVGMAFLQAYRDTGQTVYLEAAKQAAYCLVRGQLRSGGWDYRIEFDPANRRRYAYRVDALIEGARQRNTSTLDDNTTQAALRLLMALDRTLDFQDAKIHTAAQIGLSALLDVQYPIGAWPQRFTGPPDPAAFPVRKASYPESWSRTHPGSGYSAFYTFNDNAIGDTIDVMFLAAETYGDARYRKGALAAGNFILMAQMPEPQPAWAQQYDVDMHPAWARKFEPPSVTGGESQGVMRTLMQIYRQTGDKKYLKPIPPALAYFRRSLLADGQLARFCELKTNRPLYFTKEYELTYSDADMPTHYAFKVGQSLDSIERQYERLLAMDLQQLTREANARPRKATPAQIAEVREVIAALDEQGRWIEDGRLKYHGDDNPTRRVIDCRTFIHNVNVLGGYLATEP